jgi:hypothetical protein
MLLELEKQVVGIYNYAYFVHLSGIDVSYSYIWNLLKQDAK